MPEQRLDDYLTGIDAADGFYWFPPSFDEWQAIRLQTGRNRGTFLQYMHELNRAGERQSRDTLLYFGAIDDDDYVPDGEDEQ